MKTITIFCISLLFSLASFGQKAQTLFHGYIEVTNNTHVYQLGLHEGDLAIVDIETDRRDLRQFEVVTNKTRVVARRSNFDELEGYKFRIPTTGVYDFKFTGKGMARRHATVTIKREPGSGGPALLNPAFEREVTYDTTIVTYKRDTVIGTAPVETEEVDLKLFDRYVYGTEEFLNESFQLKGNLADGYFKSFDYKVPDPPEGLNYKGFNYTVKSVIGGAKHWELASAGVAIGAMFVNPAAGFAASHAMSLMGPQPGGEPTLLVFPRTDADVDYFRRMIPQGSRGALNKVSFGLLGEEKEDIGTLQETPYQISFFTTQYGQHLNIMKEGTMALGNFDPHKAKNVKVSMAAVYYTPLYQPVKSEQKVIRPKLEQQVKKVKSVNSTVTYRLLDY